MNKQQLSEALADLSVLDASDDQHILDVMNAARLVERLLPGKCLFCGGKGQIEHFVVTIKRETCPICHGSGQVWDEGIVEAVAKAIHDYWNRGSEKFEPRTAESRGQLEEARAVLSALVELLTEKGET